MLFSSVQVSRYILDFNFFSIFHHFFLQVFKKHLAIPEMENGILKQKLTGLSKYP